MAKRQLFLDTETTGLDPATGHRLTEIACVEVIDRRETGRHFHRYLNPERALDAGAFKITGLTADFLADQPKFSEIASEFMIFLKDSAFEETTLVIHNAPFDLGFLNTELGRCIDAHLPLEQSLPIIDTLVLARRLHPGQRNNLDALCRRYQIDASDRSYHGALLDAKLLMRLYWAMTAGQTQMDFKPEAQCLGAEQRQGLQGQKRIRDPNLIVRVIRATEAERAAHEARLLEMRA